MKLSSWVVVLGIGAVACEDKGGGAAASASASAAASGAAAASAPAPAPAPASASAAAPEAIAAQHVLVAYKGAQNAPKGVTRSKADAAKRAEEIAAKAKGGDFSALVAEYSDDPAAKERMGSLGKFTRDKMAKPFSDAAFKLAVGEISAPVETPFGFHVIKRNQ